ncbi:MAG: DUF1801 domain-containing protein [Calditrichaeota bacterium]|nr:MAG: DUF1801 domain-containing protein [Calditrichota bacterium]
MHSDAKTVTEYLAELPEERMKALRKVRETILEYLPKGYEEVMDWGMITYQVPLSVYPDTYNKKPLLYAALASQKNYMAVYLSGIYIDEKKAKKFEEEYKATGKRFDCGKSCVRFRKLEDLPLPLIGKTIASLEMEAFVNIIKKAGSTRKSK